MKIKLFLAAAIFLFFLLLTLPVTATEIQDINAVVDANNQITVKGKLVPGEVKQVTVKITDPDGTLEYLDQKTSDSEGNFSFSYTMQTLIDGTYHVSVGGEEIAQPSTITLDTTQPVYTVTFDSNGGTAVTSQDVEHGTVAIEPTAPTREGYSFAGWYADALLENAYGFSTLITADITLYAKWTAGEPDECFIATAAYGSKLAPGVAILRQFRDAKFLNSIPGQAFVSFYYRVSPPIAEYIAGNSLVKVLIRTMLLPVIAVAYLVMQPWLLLIVAVLLVVLYYRRRMVYR